MSNKTKLSHYERAKRRKEMAQAVEGGQSIAEVCQRFGVCSNTVETACREEGIQRPRLSAITVGTLAVVAQLLNTSKTCQQIGDKYKLTRARIHLVLQQARKAGIKFPHRSSR